MKKILFTTAYSRSSKNTWRYALRLAQHFDAQITLLHVYEDEAVKVIAGNELLDEDLIVDLKDFDADKCEDEKARLRLFAVENTPKQYHALSMNFIVTAGNVKNAIMQEEEESHYDLIVLGTTTTNRYSDVLFGSTSLKVLAQAKTPVFLVPPMATYHGLNKIVYATNFETGDAVALNQLMDWVQAFDAKLHLLHVNRNTVRAQQAAEKMERLIKSFTDEEESGILTSQLVEGSIAKSIEEYLVSTRSDMIALTTHKRGYFAQLFDSSVSNQIATEALVPVLVFKQR